MPGHTLHSVTMPRPLACHRQIIWMAALAVLLGALAPTVSRWLMLRQSVPLPMLEVCVSQLDGPSQLVIKRGAEDTTPAKPGVDRCPLCVLGDHLPGLPLSTAIALPQVPTLQEAVPALFLRAPSSLHAWASALARAPPVDFS